MSDVAIESASQPTRTNSRRRQPRPAPVSVETQSLEPPSVSTPAVANAPSRGGKRGGRAGGGGGARQQTNGNARGPPPHHHRELDATDLSSSSSSRPSRQRSSSRSQQQQSQQPLSAPRPSRRANFGGQLSSSTPASSTTPNSSSVGSPSAPSTPHGDRPAGSSRGERSGGKRGGRGGANGRVAGGRGGAENQEEEARVKLPEPKDDDDLATRLTYAVSNPPFPDCSICFNSIFPTQAIWTCVPAPPDAFGGVDGAEGEIDGIKDGEVVRRGEGTACWGIFHLKCINDWASRSVRDVSEWRCPGCQTKRTSVPTKSECFCRRTTNPKPSRLATPHSCGDFCSRKRRGCDHPCPLSCHPGPCPPCSVSLLLPCPSHSTPIMTRCSHLNSPSPHSHSTSSTPHSLPSCGQICSKPLACGNPAHVCSDPCHEGECISCPVTEEIRCYCGEEVREGACGEGKREEAICGVEGGDVWEGRFACERECGRAFDCGKHRCQSKCHPHSLTPLPCPFSPSLVLDCPCGKHSLDGLPHPPRKTCEDPVPTCGEVCGKSLDGCEHHCKAKCHTGPCSPCNEKVTLPCRCGESKVTRACHVRTAETLAGLSEIHCERVCKALRSCRKHECGRVCCPLAYKGMRSKSKRRAVEEEGDGEEESELHQCTLICGKQLSCGNHTCPARDHRGPCPPCLEASYEELICNCRRTVVYPPIPCGRTLSCTYPCARPAPLCGHPKQPHQCHESPNCPPCIFLVSKLCACGKSEVKNVRCSQERERVSCGKVCGRLLKCGGHRCEKGCHVEGECESPCTKPCGKPRKICHHSCQAPCHSPSACDESVPCPANVFQTCACGRIQQQTACGASTSLPTSRSKVVLKCVAECERALRNERLAAALGISKSRTDKTAVEWSSETIAAGLAVGLPAVQAIEKVLNDFVTGSRASQILPHMPQARRDFVLTLSEQYRLTADLVDQEPARSVRIARRIDSRVPHPAASSAVEKELVARQKAQEAARKPSLLNTNMGGGKAGAGAWAGVAKPKANPWGSTPGSSARPSPVASSVPSPRPASPALAPMGTYVPPSLRKTAPVVETALSSTAPASYTSTPPSLPSTSPVSTSSLNPQAATFVSNDDTWEKSDEEA